MLLKLIKNDFKNYSRKFGSVLLILLSISLFTISLKDGKYDYIYRLANIIVLATIVCLSISMIVVTVKEKFISSKAYLNFSLPVNKMQHIYSHLIVISIWGIIIFISWMLLGMLVFYGIEETIDLFRHLNYQRMIDALLPICILFVQCVKDICLIYLSILFINSFSIKKFSKLFGIVFFVLISYMEAFLYGIISNKLMLENSSSFIDSIYCMYFYCDFSKHNSFIFNIIFPVIFGAIYLLISSYLIEKKVELD